MVADINRYPSGADMRNHILLPLCAAMLASLAATAQAEFQYHHRVNGLIKAAPPPPACVDAKTAAPGTLSDRFCSHEGMELFNAGLVGGHAVLYGLSDDPGPTSWSPTATDIPALPNCSSIVDCMRFTDGQAYTASLAAHSATATHAVSACTGKGEGWYMPSLAEMVALADLRGHPDFARMNACHQGYRTSNENGAGGSPAIIFNFYPNNYVIANNADKIYNHHLRVRCARRV